MGTRPIQAVNRAAFLPGGSRGGPLFMTFLAPTGPVHSLVCGLFHFKANNGWLSLSHVVSLTMTLLTLTVRDICDCIGTTLSG